MRDIIGTQAFERPSVKEMEYFWHFMATYEPQPRRNDGNPDVARANSEIAARRMPPLTDEQIEYEGVLLRAVDDDSDSEHTIDWANEQEMHAAAVRNAGRHIKRSRIELHELLKKGAPEIVTSGGRYRLKKPNSARASSVTSADSGEWSHVECEVGSAGGGPRLSDTRPPVAVTKSVTCTACTDALLDAQLFPQNFKLW